MGTNINNCKELNALQALKALDEAVALARAAFSRDSCILRGRVAFLTAFAAMLEELVQKPDAADTILGSQQEPVRERPKKILIADDECHILSVVSSKLREAGYDPITAHDGEDAFVVAFKERPDLIISDNCMPGLSGLELAQSLRATRIPFILLAARNYEVTHFDRLNSGISEVLSKPFSPRALLASVDAVFNNSANVCKS